MAHKLAQTKPGPEHEAFLRAPFTGRVQFWAGLSTQPPALGEARELSVGGLYLESDEVLNVGSHVTLRFSVDARTVSVLGEVVRMVKGGMLYAAGMGIRFLDLSADDSRAVIEYVVRSRR